MESQVLSIRAVALLIGLVLGLTPVSTRTSARNQEDSWGRFAGEGEEFAVLMPRPPSVYFNTITNAATLKIPERIYSSYVKGVIYLVVSYNGSTLKGTLENFKLHHCSSAEFSFVKDKTLSGHAGKEYSLKLGHAVGALDIYNTRKHGYAVAIIQTKDDPILREFFLSTFSLDLQAGPPANLTGNVSPPSLELSNLPQAKLSEGVASGKAQVTTKPIVVSKPEPSYTDEARNAGVTGSVVLRVIFNSSGEVSNIQVVSGLSHGLNERAIEAAHHLNFIPAIKDDRFVPYWMELQYNFNLY